MSVYNILILHNGLLNNITNSTDMIYNNVSTLSLSTADCRYLKISGGTVTGNIIVNNNETLTNLTDTNATITSETLTLTLTPNSSY